MATYGHKVRAGKHRRALAEECGDAFQAVARDRGRGDRRALELHLRLQRRVEAGGQQFLHGAIGPGGARGDLRGQLLGFGGQFGILDHARQQSPLECFLGAEAAIREDQFLRTAQANDARQEIAGAAVGYQAGTGVGHRELRRARRQHQVAAGGEAETGAGSGAVDRDDQRCAHVREIGDCRVQVGRELLDEALQVAGVLDEAVEVAAGAEHASLAGQQHRAHRRGAAAGQRGLQQFLRQLHADAVGGIGSVQGDARDAAVDDEVEGRERCHVPGSPQRGAGMWGRREHRQRALSGQSRAAHWRIAAPIRMIRGLIQGSPA